jgi:hypothetical protein
VKPSYPHRIRLHGPWECEPLEYMVRDGAGRLVPAEDALPRARRVRPPGRLRDFGLPGFAGRVRFRRRFGYPGHIDDYERVWLTIAGAEGAAEIWLNQQYLGRAEAGSFEMDVTRWLRERNQLDVVLEAASDAAGLTGEVALEIRCTAFLRYVQAWSEQQTIHVAGEVVGTCDGLLELYAVAGRKTIAYAAIGAAPHGQSFHLTSDPADGLPESGTVHIELVNVATVWYAMDLPYSQRVH